MRFKQVPACSREIWQIENKNLTEIGTAGLQLKRFLSIPYKPSRNKLKLACHVTI